jgi:hypothetical protein
VAESMRRPSPTHSLHSTRVLSPTTRTIHGSGARLGCPSSTRLSLHPGPARGLTDQIPQEGCRKTAFTNGGAMGNHTPSRRAMLRRSGLSRYRQGHLHRHTTRSRPAQPHHG